MWSNVHRAPADSVAGKTTAGPPGPRARPHGSAQKSGALGPPYSACFAHLLSGYLLLSIWMSLADLLGLSSTFMSL